MTDIISAYHDEEILEILDGWDDSEMEFAEDSTDEFDDKATNTYPCERCGDVCVIEENNLVATCKFLHEHKVCRDCFSEKWCPAAKKEANAMFTLEDRKVVEEIVRNHPLMTLPSKDAKPVIPPITTSKSQLNTKIHPMDELIAEEKKEFEKRSKEKMDSLYPPHVLEKMDKENKPKKKEYIPVKHNSSRVKGTCGRMIYRGPNAGKYCGRATIYKNNHQGRCDYHYSKWIKENPFLAKH